MRDVRAEWPLPEAALLRDELVAAWDRDGYHDLRHLAEVLERLDELAAAGEAFPEVPVRLAAWFHDAVYEGRPDDEERSAAWAERALPGLLDAGAVGEVARLVRMTAAHDPDPDDDAGCALSDADLGILAASAERYAAYVRQVRGEYAHVDDAAFASGRAQLLRELASRPALFRTTAARERWEDAARANLAAELAVLEDESRSRGDAGPG